jgi:hypothetical protein
VESKNVGTWRNRISCILPFGSFHIERRIGDYGGAVHLLQGATFSRSKTMVFKLALTCEPRMCVLQSARLCRSLAGASLTGQSAKSRWREVCLVLQLQIETRPVGELVNH